MILIPLSELPSRLNQFIRAIGRGKSFFENIVRAKLIEWTEQRFQQEGPGWAEWSRAWARKRVRDGTSEGGILQWQQFLKQSISGGPDHIEDIAQNRMRFGTNVMYAAVQQYGRESDNTTLRGGIEDFIPGASRVMYGGGAGIPPRPFLYLEGAQVEELGEYYAEWVLDQAQDILGGGSK